MRVVDHSRQALRVWRDNLQHHLATVDRDKVVSKLAELMGQHGFHGIERWTLEVIRESAARCKSEDGPGNIISRRLLEAAVPRRYHRAIDPNEETQRALADLRATPVLQNPPSLMGLLQEWHQDPQEFDRRHPPRGSVGREEDWAPMRQEESA